MSDDPVPDEPDDVDDSAGGSSEGPRSQPIRHGSVGARVPDHVRAGVFSTGVVVLQSTHEFVLDFLLRIAQPQQVSSRVVLAPPVVAGFIRALEDNLAKYGEKFGAPIAPRTRQEPAEPPAPDVESASSEGETGTVLVGAGDAASGPRPAQPSAEDLYDDLRLPDEMLAGVYANAVMISHSPTEFCFDFLTTFFPRSAVSARVFLAAANVPTLLGSLKHAFATYQGQRSGGPDEQTPGE